LTKHVTHFTRYKNSTSKKINSKYANIINFLNNSDEIYKFKIGLQVTDYRSNNTLQIQ